MPYVSGGQVLDNQSMWRKSIFYDFFWGAIDFIVIFFRTMIDPDLSKNGTSTQTSYSNRGSGRPPPGPPGPRRRMGGIKRMGGASPPPMAGGG